MASDMGVFVASIVGAIGGVLAFGASLHASGQAKATAKEVARLNDRFSKEQKEHEYRLAYLSDVAKRRLDAYQRILALTTSVTNKMQSTEPLKNNEFLEKSSEEITSLVWLNTDTGNKVKQWLCDISEYIHERDNPEFHARTKWALLTARTYDLNKRLLSDIVKIDSLEGLVADLKESQFLPPSESEPK